MNYQAILEEIHEEVLHLLPCGTVATYIPQLATVSPQKFGMAVQTVGGEIFHVGHAFEPFSIQSISGPSGFNMGKGGFTQYSEVPLLCKEGTGEVEAWKRNTEASFFNLSPFVPLYPTFILPLQRGGSLPRTLRSGSEEPNTHGKPGSAAFQKSTP